mmetsp:Transcript_15029/g.39014  ORF Transcript_15029/g.39014 Transcript_15029/m.39014 type:complete len:163 (-) Transcript_15029:257-745(-)
MVVKTEVCAFSGSRIYPGHGITFVRQDNKSFKFVSAKVKCYFAHRWNPRKLAWTQMYRRLHKKGTLEETQKKRSRKAQKGVSKAVVGATLDVIKAKRNQKPEVRTAAREAALREAKERNRVKQQAKKSAPKPAGGGSKPQDNKAMGKQPKAPKGGGKTGMRR